MTMRTMISRAAALVAAAALTAGCAGAGNEDSRVGGGAESTPSEVARAQSERARSQSSPGAAGDRTNQTSDSSKVSAAKDPASSTPRIARTARVSLDVADVEQGAARVRSLARDVGGFVSSEESRLTTDEQEGRAWAEITISVPAKELDSALTDLEDVGELTRRSTDAADLTSQYTDTTARVRTLRASVARLQKLIDTAEDLDQVVALERELSQREADLESMTSQQKALEQRTSMSAVTVSLTTPTAEDGEATATGFLSGLARGWDALVTTVQGGLTALGAVTPFAITLGVLAAPLLWWVRRRRRGSEPAA